MANAKLPRNSGWTSPCAMPWLMSSSESSDMGRKAAAQKQAARPWKPPR